jgi:hypothetical protein
VKLGKNASDTCAMLSKDYRGEIMKKSSVLNGVNGLKRVTRTWKMKKSGDRRSHRINENVEKVWNIMHLDGYLSIRAMAMQLNLNKETVKIKGLNFGPP